MNQSKYSKVDTSDDNQMVKEGLRQPKANHSFIPSKSLDEKREIKKLAKTSQFNNKRLLTFKAF